MYITHVWTYYITKRNYLLWILEWEKNYFPVPQFGVNNFTNWQGTGTNKHQINISLSHEQLKFICVNILNHQLYKHVPIILVSNQDTDWPKFWVHVFYCTIQSKSNLTFISMYLYIHYLIHYLFFLLNWKSSSLVADILRVCNFVFCVGVSCMYLCS